jgi:hypothetical protein
VSVFRTWEDVGQLPIRGLGRGGKLSPREEVGFVAAQLEADADSSRRFGTRRMTVKTLDAYAARLRKALKSLPSEGQP